VVVDSPDYRASDADRERVAEVLRRHCGDGRLSLDELSERLGEVYAARTLGQLRSSDGPLRELPDLRPPPPVPLNRPARPTLDRTTGDHRGRTLSEHVGAYALSCAVLVAVWALTGAGYFWPAWVIGVWGFAVAGHVAAATRAQRPDRAR